MHELFVEYAVPAIGAALAAILAWAGRYAIAYLSAKAEAATKGGIQERTLRASAAMTAFLTEGVVYVEAELRPLVKRFGADGKIAPDEAAVLRVEAVKLAIAWAKTRAHEVFAAAGWDDDRMRKVAEGLVDALVAKLARDANGKPVMGGYVPPRW